MPRRPNLLFIFTDEQRADTMRCYGNHYVRTPALDALADESFIFESAYVTQPVCTPSRSSIMTGLYPHTNGCVNNKIPLRAGTRTLAEFLPQEYATAYMGKWHLGDEIFAQHGFREWVGTEDHYRGTYSTPERLRARPAAPRPTHSRTPAGSQPVSPVPAAKRSHAGHGKERRAAFHPEICRTVARTAHQGGIPGGGSGAVHWRAPRRTVRAVRQFSGAASAVAGAV